MSGRRGWRDGAGAASGVDDPAGERPAGVRRNMCSLEHTRTAVGNPSRIPSPLLTAAAVRPRSAETVPDLGLGRDRDPGPDPDPDRGLDRGPGPARGRRCRPRAGPNRPSTPTLPTPGGG